MSKQFVVVDGELFVSHALVAEALVSSALIPSEVKTLLEQEAVERRVADEELSARINSLAAR